MFPIPSATESESASRHRYFPGVEFFPPRDANSVGAAHRDNLPAPCAPPSHVRAATGDRAHSACFGRSDAESLQTSNVCTIVQE